MKTQFVLLLLTLGLLCLSLMGTPYPREQWLQHMPTVLGLLGLSFIASKRWLSTFSFTLLVLFLWLHILGARWIYSFVPYDTWAESLFGFRFDTYFQWERNHYDRLVHWCFGLLFLLPFRELLISRGRISGGLASWLAWSFILAVSSVYEILEWQLAVWMSPEYAESYNGQQGDMWDAQQDMALAAGGALFIMLLHWVVRWIQKLVHAKRENS